MPRADYPKSARVRLRQDFRKLMSDARFHPGAECVVRVLLNDLGRPRLGIAAPRRYGRAIRRNRFKRLVREAFRALQGELGAVDLLVSPRKSLEEPTLAGLTADLRVAPRRARAGQRRPS